MGDLHTHPDVLLVVALFSRHDEAFAWASETLSAAHGPVALASDRFDFAETNYYEATMGPRLRKQFWAFARPFEPAALVEAKLATNRWEAEYAALGRHNEPRPLNLDPGYITPAKLVLASTKDHAHRVYLDRGIYAEVTLHYQHGAWRAADWTFPDYRRPEYHAFFVACREYLRRRQREEQRA